jgi:putative peptidoglycan lipid II flippase
VAAGIFSSRLLGLVRERIVAHFFGVNPLADVFAAALRAPNVLQNLLGEQSLSAAFIPIYSRFVEQGREAEARRFAGAIFGLLTAAVVALVLLGMALAEPLVAILTPGFLGDADAVAAGETTVDRYALAVRAVRWIFPMTGLLVLSAWALGILNSHRRFFLPYFAPVLWNLAIIGAFLVAGAQRWTMEGILYAGCAGALLGGALQFVVQLPLAWRLLGGFRPSLAWRAPGVQRALKAFGPALAGRGVLQLSLYVDLLLASFLAVGGMAAVRYGSFLYILPVSLFALSVAAVELPELARSSRTAAELETDPDQRRKLAARVHGSLAQIASLVLPTFLGYLAFGFLLVGALFRTGEFGLAGNWLVYVVLCGYSLGLPASTTSRLLQNVFFALEDTRTPARVAGVRVAISAAVAVVTLLPLDRVPLHRLLSEEFAAALAGETVLYLGALALALGSAVGSWTELLLLRRALRGRIPEFRLPVARGLRLAALALASALPAIGLWVWLPAAVTARPLVAAPVVLGAYAALYLGIGTLLRMPELAAWREGLSRLPGFRGRRSGGG